MYSQINNFVSLDFEGEEVETDDGAGAAAPSNENKNIVSNSEKTVLCDRVCARQILQRRDLPSARLQLARHHIQGLEAGQRAPGSRGPHQAHGLRDVQGGDLQGKHPDLTTFTHYSRYLYCQTIDWALLK